MIALLGLIPLKDWLYLGAISALIAGSALFIHHERGIGAAKVEAVRTEEHRQAAAVAASAIAGNQAESNRRIAATLEIVHATQQSASAVAAMASSATRERDAMRVQLAAVVRASRLPDHSASAGSASPVQGSDATGVLARLLDESDRRAGVYAGVAEERRIRALGCERANDALSP